MLDGSEFRTRDFEETPWRLAEDILVHGKPVGLVEVGYHRLSIHPWIRNGFHDHPANLPHLSLVRFSALSPVSCPFCRKQVMHDLVVIPSTRRTSMHLSALTLCTPGRNNQALLERRHRPRSFANRGTYAVPFCAPCASASLRKISFFTMDVSCHPVSEDIPLPRTPAETRGCVLAALILVLVLVTVAGLGCGGGGGSDSPASVAPSPEEAVTAYLGQASPVSTFQDGAYVHHLFEPTDGPMCLRGGAFWAGTRDTPSEDLLIYLQGGGACWSTLCRVTEEADPEVFQAGLLNSSLEDNPFRNWDVAYVPYCDGSLFVGDIDIDDDGDGEIDRYHRGLRNFSAAMDVFATAFPSPRRVVLCGSSAGAYGTTTIGAMLVRRVYPGVELQVISDAGLGMGKPGNEAFIRGLLDEWNITHLIPGSCSDCLNNGHITQLIAWALDNDPDMTVAAISSWGDFVIGTLFLGMAPRTYRGVLAEETGRLAESYPERYRRFLFDGTQHTATGLDSTIENDDPNPITEIFGPAIATVDETRIEGTSVANWLTEMVNHTPLWRDLLE